MCTCSYGCSPGLITLAFQSTDPVLAIQGQYSERHCVLAQRTQSSTWIFLLDWLAWRMYTLVLCAEMEVGKSAIYALLSPRSECRNLRNLGAKKKCESWDPSQKNRNSSPGREDHMIKYPRQRYRYRFSFVPGKGLDLMSTPVHPKLVCFP